MKTQIIRIIISAALAAGIAGLVAGCASGKSESARKEEPVTLAQLSAPARTTVEKETAGGKVESIVKEVERGKVVYDVEASVGGKHLEYLVADSDGAILGTETQIEFSQLPQPVRLAAENFFGTSAGLVVMKGVEYGETHYEIEGRKNGKTVEVTFDPTGRRTE